MMQLHSICGRNCNLVASCSHVKRSLEDMLRETKQVHLEKGLTEGLLALSSEQLPSVQLHTKKIVTTRAPTSTNTIHKMLYSCGMQSLEQRRSLKDQYIKLNGLPKTLEKRRADPKARASPRSFVSGASIKKYAYIKK